MVLSFAISSCKKDDKPDEPTYLSVSPTSISFNASKSTTTININSNAKWRITDKPSWISVSLSEGENARSVEVSCEENAFTEERTGSFIVRASDGSTQQTVEIKQSGKEVALSVDVTNINLTSGANASQTINITCNSSWTLSGNPEWLQVSSNSGNGNSSISITSRSANDSSKDRSASLIISSEGKSVTVTVIQEAGLVSCISTPSNITPLYYAVVFNLDYSQEVATTKLLLISDYEYKHKTDIELIAAIEKEESEIPESHTIYTRGVDDDTDYHILTLSYDRKGNRGELVDVKFKSPKEYNGTDDAWCRINDAGITSSSFLFSVVKQGRCEKYDVIYGANIYPLYCSGPVMAFEINYYRNNGKKNWLAENWQLQIELNYPNDHTFACSYSTAYNYGGVIATTWGIFSDGTHSSDITTVSGDTYADNVASLTGHKEKSSEMEWIRNQKGWIKITPDNLKK